MGAREPERYRNKAQFPVAIQRGKVVAGCYAKGTHDVVATDHCLIQHEYNDIIVKEALQLISQFGLSVYDERRGTGLVRHVMGRVAPGTGECIAVIVTSSRKFPRAREFAKALMARVPQLVGVVQNINPEKTNIILGKDTRILEGRGYVDDLFGNERIGTLRFRISPLSFYQVNTEQAARLYEKALDYADLKRWETAIDLYSGIGTITLFLAQKCSSAIGIEEVFEAVKDARQNQKLNGIRNASFVNGRAERVLPSVLARTGVQPNVIVLDPPRKGCDPLLLSTLARARPERVVYISCYPPTLARDLAVLHKHGYATIEVQPIDLFPYTSHVETVALVSRR
jgi:23S rRNA (uracil1939-C5)-methyltransferase